MNKEKPSKINAIFTLKYAIEKTLKEKIPEIKKVLQVKMSVV